MIPISSPVLGDAEQTAVRRVLESGRLMQGPQVEAFERSPAEYTAAPHVVVCSSGTAALHRAPAACGVGPGDEVIVPSLSFIATANAVRHCGAEPIFAEIDERTFNLDPAASAAAITPRTRAIMPVHQIGLSADLSAFRDLCRRHDLALVEDAACALGSRYRGEQIGAGSAPACFSFHPRKVITTGEGGAVTTRSAEIAEKMRLLRQHGLVGGRFVATAFNYRLTDLQAAVGLEQMKRLDEMIRRRREIAARYDHDLADLADRLRTPFVRGWVMAKSVPSTISST